MKTITIKTRLADGIYRSEGGGQVRTHYEWATGPRNLLKAIELLNEHRRAMAQSYGNIGCGRSWLEIDGACIHDFDLDKVARDDREYYGADAPARLIKTCTEKARELLAEVAAGYNPRKYDISDAEWEEIAGLK